MYFKAFVFAVICLVFPKTFARVQIISGNGLRPPKSFVSFHQSDNLIPSCSVPKQSFYRNGRTPESFRWKDFAVVLHESFGEDAAELLKNAFNTLDEILPCVNFSLFLSGSRPTSGDFVHVIPGQPSQCNSLIGRQGWGEQTLKLGPGCLTQTTVFHELIHALGLHHEQCRCDRDDFITVKFENVEPGLEHNFEKVCEGYSTYGVEYNTKSIMHYPSIGFSKNGEPTILTKGGKLIPFPYDVQSTDVKKLQLMYNCTSQGIH